ncbi:MAG: helix-turn-helix domain-containing protein [Streptosporangiales bacterium]|nr:helix-turn-helix domain-containing protein [Streptosporangiales bacterium]
MSGFSEVVRQYMEVRGLGVRALARSAGYDPSYLSKVLRDRKPYGADIARHLDEALSAGGEIIQAAAAPPPSPRDPEEPVAPELVSYFRTQLAGHYSADMFLGPKNLIPTVQAQTELLMDLASRADAAVRPGLLDTGAAYAALLGWLHQDAGDLTSSARWRDITLSLAHRSGSPELVSYALTNKAMLALDSGNGRAVTDYAQAALAGERQLPAKCRILALQHQAQGEAMLGNRAVADRLLDSAAGLTGRVDDEHPWGNACRRTPHYVEVQRATCYGRTGAPADAADAAGLWDQIMKSMPAEARRDNAVFAARQAQALAQVPDPHRVLEITAAAAETVPATGSARLRRELGGIRERARPWIRTRAGRELSGILAGIG